jgi:hypothetical protein
MSGMGHKGECRPRRGLARTRPLYLSNRTKSEDGQGSSPMGQNQKSHPNGNRTAALEKEGEDQSPLFSPQANRLEAVLNLNGG